ncbi:hypothetical protein B0H11DRAFT_902556 [Mycena galericulata]|nr:hypothetical protein B0H11DRAFT_902556 [Mycena galericulata]
MEADGELWLPLELEREIFEWTAIVYPRMIPTLLRVAHCVKLWVEPYLYRSIRIRRNLPPYSIMESDLLRPTPQSKPASFYRDAVRYLYLDGSSWSWSPNVLGVCTRTRTFAVLDATPALLPILRQMNLRELGIHLQELFGDPRHIDLKHSLFDSITHLDIYDLITEDDTQIAPHLAALPALTHLCLNNHVPAHILQALASDLPGLHIFVNLLHGHSIAPAHLSRLLRPHSSLSPPFEDPPLRDPRFVISVYLDSGVEWEASARGAPDFWSAVEDFLALKRSGEIPESCYWMPYWNPREWLRAREREF